MQDRGDRASGTPSRPDRCVAGGAACGERLRQPRVHARPADPPQGPHHQPAACCPSQHQRRAQFDCIMAQQCRCVQSDTRSGRTCAARSCATCRSTASRPSSPPAPRSCTLVGGLCPYSNQPGPGTTPNGNRLYPLMKFWSVRRTLTLLVEAIFLLPVALRAPLLTRFAADVPQHMVGLRACDQGLTCDSGTRCTGRWTVLWQRTCWSWRVLRWRRSSTSTRRVRSANAPADSSRRTLPASTTSWCCCLQRRTAGPRKHTSMTCERLHRAHPGGKAAIRHAFKHYRIALSEVRTAWRMPLS